MPGALPLLLLSACGGSPPAELGSLEGGLAPCPGTSNCVHTGDGVPEGTAPFHLAEEWMERPMGELALVVRAAVEELPRTEVVRVDHEGADSVAGSLYLRAESTSLIFRFVDDLEMFLEAGDAELVVRSASRLGKADLGVNGRRVTALRTGLLDAGVIRR